MTDVFISYKSERRNAAKHLSRILELNGFSVWFDYGLLSGTDFGPQIEREIRDAKAVIVLWCSLSRESRWVREEADLATRLGTFTPAWLERVDPPLGFARADTIDLASWDGAPRSHLLDRLLNEIGRRVGRDPSPSFRGLQEYEAEWRSFGAPPLSRFALNAPVAEREEARGIGIPSEPAAKVAAKNRPKGPIKITECAALNLDDSAGERAKAFWADWAPNGHHIVTVGVDTTAQLWDVSTGECFQRLTGHEKVVRHATYSRDGRLVATVCDDGLVRIWDLTDNRTTPFFLGKADLRWLPRQVSVSGDGKLVSCADFAGRVSIFCIMEGEQPPAFTFRAQRDYCLASEFSANNDTILTCGSEGTAEIWPVPNLDTLPEGFKPRTANVFRGHIGSVHNASFSSDADRVATAGRDGTARVWDAKSGRQLYCTPRLSSPMNSGHISPCGSMLIASCDDKLARIWSLDTGELIGTAEGHTERVRSARFSPDGRKFVTASFDNTARIWEISH